MQYMDQSGLYTMEDILVNLKSQGKNIALVNPHKQPKLMMERIKLIPELVPETQIFNDFETCLQWILKNTTNKF